MDLLACAKSVKLLHGPLAVVVVKKVRHEYNGKVKSNVLENYYLSSQSLHNWSVNMVQEVRGL